MFKWYFNVICEIAECEILFFNNWINFRLLTCFHEIDIPAENNMTWENHLLYILWLYCSHSNVNILPLETNKINSFLFTHFSNPIARPLNSKHEAENLLIVPGVPYFVAYFFIYFFFVKELKRDLNKAIRN